MIVASLINEGVYIRLTVNNKFSFPFRSNKKICFTKFKTLAWFFTSLNLKVFLEFLQFIIYTLNEIFLLLIILLYVIFYCNSILTVYNFILKNDENLISAFKPPILFWRNLSLQCYVKETYSWIFTQYLFWESMKGNRI